MIFQFYCFPEDFQEHFLSQAAGLGILATGVITIYQYMRGFWKTMNGSMLKGHSAQRDASEPEIGLVGDVTQCDDNFYIFE